MEPFRLSGIWWLPGDDEHPIPGTVSFSFDEGLRLEFDGLLDGHLPSFKLHRYPIIHGVADRKLITLISSHTISQGINSTTGGHGAVKAEAAVFDVHLQEDQAQTSVASFEFGHLSDWAHLSGVTMQHEATPTRLISMNMEYKTPDPVLAEIAGFQIVLGPIFSTNIRELHRYQWMESVSLKVTSDAPLTIPQWASKIVRPLGRLIDFATGIHNHVVELAFYFPREHAYDQTGLHGCPAIHVVLDHGSAPESSRYQHEMLFMLGDIRQEFASVIKNWLEICQKYPEFFDLYFGSTYETRAPLRERFYSVIRALESYHRQVLQSPDLVEEEQLQRVDKLLSLIQNHFPPEFEDWANSKLRYGYEPTLGNRLNQMLADWKALTHQLLGSDREMVKFVRGVLNTRNCLTHFSRDSCDRALTGTGIFFATEVLIMMASAYLLKMMGIEPERAANMVMSKQDFSNLSRRISETKSPWDEAGKANTFD